MQMILAVLTAIGGAGCGGVHRNAVPAPGIALTRFVQAYRAGDYRTACEYAVPHPGFPRHMESAWQPTPGPPTPPQVVKRLEAARRVGCERLLNTYAALRLLPLTFGVASVKGVAIRGRTARVCLSERGPARATDFPKHGSIALAAYPVVWLVTLDHARWLVMTVHDVGLCPLPV